MTFKKLIAAMDMLNALVFLSIQGRRTLAAIRKTASMMTRAIACTILARCANAINTALRKMYPSTGTMK